MEQVYYLSGCKLADRSGHEAGWALLEALYAAHGEGPLPQIARGHMGKPYFVDSGWHFSITHTCRHAFCALARTPIGIDAEEWDRRVDLRIAPKILSPGEFAQFSAAADPRLALLKFWVLKEAEAKCSGKGITYHPRYTNFSLDDPRIQERDGCLLAVVL